MARGAPENGNLNKLFVQDFWHTGIINHKECDGKKFVGNFEKPEVTKAHKTSMSKLLYLFPKNCIESRNILIQNFNYSKL